MNNEKSGSIFSSKHIDPSTKYSSKQGELQLHSQREMGTNHKKPPCAQAPSTKILEKENINENRPGVYIGRTGYKGSYRLSISPHNNTLLSNRYIDTNGQDRPPKRTFNNLVTSPFVGSTGVLNHLVSRNDNLGHEKSIEYDIQDRSASRGASPSNNYQSYRTINNGLGNGVISGYKDFKQATEDKEIYKERDSYP